VTSDSNLGQVRPGRDTTDGGRARTVSDLIVDVLADAGVQRIYGVTGDALNAFVDALRKDRRIDWVSVNHEETAAFAAAARSAGIGVNALLSGCALAAVRAELGGVGALPMVCGYAADMRAAVDPWLPD